MPAKIVVLDGHFINLRDLSWHYWIFGARRLRALRHELPSEKAATFVVAYHVGCRKGELMRIQWYQGNLQATRIRLEPGMTKN